MTLKHIECTQNHRGHVFQRSEFRLLCWINPDNIIQGHNWRWEKMKQST